MDAKFITHAISKSWNWRQNEDFAVNMFLKWFESDFISITKAGYMHEVEVKISRHDFKADFEKSSRKWDFKAKKDKVLIKHEAIKAGEYGLKTFSFATPEGLLSRKEIPEYCGHYEVNENGLVITLKDPPILNNPKKIDENELHSLKNFYKWRWRKLYFEGIK